jgi:hypothetical protein
MGISQCRGKGYTVYLIRPFKLDLMRGGKGEQKSSETLGYLFLFRIMAY